MAPRDPSHEPTATPDPVEKGFATLATLRYHVHIAICAFETDVFRDMLTVTAGSG